MASDRNFMPWILGGSVLGIAAYFLLRKKDEKPETIGEEIDRLAERVNMSVRSASYFADRPLKAAETACMQRKLLDGGYYASGRASDADGQIGPRTRDAIARFIAANMLPEAATPYAIAVSLGCVAPEGAVEGRMSGAQASYSPSKDTILCVQKKLLTGGYYQNLTPPGSARDADGTWGPRSAAAVAAYQTYMGLPVTRVVDQATAESLGCTISTQGGGV